MSLDLSVWGWFILFNILLTALIAFGLARGMRRSWVGPSLVGGITGIVPPINILYLALFVIFGRRQGAKQNVRTEKPERI